MLYFSAQTSGFYDSRVHRSLPDDARPVDADTHAALLAAQAAGRTISADDQGDPVALVPPFDAPALMAGLRIERDRLLNLCDWTQIADAPLNDAARNAWRTYRQQLRDLPDTVADLTAIDWPTPPVF